MILLIPLILRTLISVSLRPGFVSELEAELVEESVIKRLIASIKCGVCGQRYAVGSVSILGHCEDLWYLKALCSACRTQSLVAVVIKEDGLLEPVTDLTEAELDRFRDIGVLTADDVLDTHNFLKDFNGEFSQLFCKDFKKK